jgi:hypothetical protein
VALIDIVIVITVGDVTVVLPWQQAADRSR